MSNLTRLEKNNQDLEALKTGIENLPDYQDLEYLYDTASFYKIPFDFKNDNNLLISKWRNFILFNISKINYVYKLENNEAIFLFSFTSPNDYSNGRYKLISGNLDRNVLFACGCTDSWNGDSVYAKVGVIKIDLTEENCLIIYENTKVRSERYYTYDTVVIDDTHFITGLSGDNRYYLCTINTENDTVVQGGAQSSQGSSYSCLTQVSKNSYACYQYYSNNKDGLVKIVNNNGNISTIAYSASRGTIRGHNYDMTKIFLSDGIFELNSDMTIGNKIADYDNNLLYLFPISINLYAQYSYIDNYSARTFKVYTFDEETNTFTLFDSNFKPFLITQEDIMGCDTTNSKIVEQIVDNIKKAFKLDGKIYSLDNTKNIMSDKVLNHYEAFDNTYTKITGTMPNNGELNITPSTTQQTIPAGYTSGGTVAAVDNTIDENIIQANIRAGVTILGIEGNLEPDKPDQTKTVTPSATQQVVEPDTGYELSSVTVNPIPLNIYCQRSRWRWYLEYSYEYSI